MGPLIMLSHVMLGPNELNLIESARIGGNMALNVGDIVEELATNRRGKISSVTEVRWQVRFLDGNKPVSAFFFDESELRLVEPSDQDGGPVFVL